MGSHPSFHVCRRFTRLRARLLLVKQDELSSLEAQLDEVDRQETRLLFLGNRRRDKNGERLELIAKIDDALSDYGMFEICGIVSCLPDRYFAEEESEDLELRPGAKAGYC